MIHNAYDYILVGGGLQSGLLSLAITARQPQSRILLIERDARLGGNHTWAYHSSDLPETARDWMADLAEFRWPGYRVRFNDYERRIGIPYCTTSSDHFSRVVASLFDSDGAKSESHHRLLASTEVTQLSANRVTVSDGSVFDAACVIDCRGPGRSAIDATRCGYQKFVGWEVELSRPWLDREPVVMDAVGPQLDGFRFFYSLPFEPRRVLVEDTCFSDRPELDLPAYRERLSVYLQQRTADWRVVREETGCLPMPFSFRSSSANPRVLSGGYAGGWFHAATGYSFPLAVRFAEAVASTGPLDAVRAARELGSQHRLRAAFSRFLNRLLYRLVDPQSRWQIFRRFYRVLSEQSISRFYAHEYNVYDAMRIVIGRPPGGLTPIRFLRKAKVQPCC